MKEPTPMPDPGNAGAAADEWAELVNAAEAGDSNPETVRQGTSLAGDPSNSLAIGMAQRGQSKARPQARRCCIALFQRQAGKVW